MGKATEHKDVTKVREKKEEFLTLTQIRISLTLTTI